MFGNNRLPTKKRRRAKPTNRKECQKYEVTRLVWICKIISRYSRATRLIRWIIHRRSSICMTQISIDSNGTRHTTPWNRWEHFQGNRRQQLLTPLNFNRAWCRGFNGNNQKSEYDSDRYLPPMDLSLGNTTTTSDYLIIHSTTASIKASSHLQSISSHTCFNVVR